MTCIVAVKENRRLIVGGDSAGVGGYHLTVRKDPKVFFNGPFLFGITSSFRMRDLLEFSFVPPEHPKKVSDREYMATLFIDAVRSCFEKGGYLVKHHVTQEGGVRSSSDTRVIFMRLRMTSSWRCQWRISRQLGAGLISLSAHCFQHGV